MRTIQLTFILLTSLIVNAQLTLYVQPDATATSANGTLLNPYNDIATAVDLVATGGGGQVIVIDGEYEMTGKEVTITTAATATTAVIIKPQSQAGVKFNFKGRFGFHFSTSSGYITLEGFELDGETDSVDYWTIVARAFWRDTSIATNGGLAIILDGQNITIKDNYIHDWYQKAVEIRDGRYVIVQGNIIHNIATTSLTGGHGIMRQQKGQEFFDDDILGEYRWDIKENMLFNIEQRIYSWVPSKGFIEMVIDEGKSILIDDPFDSDLVQENMSARIKNNIVAFGSVDHIRLKSTPNLEVSNNSIYTTGANADGITDKAGDTTTPKFTNFIFTNNASQTLSTRSALEIDNAIAETLTAGGTPIIYGNYTMNGKKKPNDEENIEKLTGDQLFISPTTGNFRINPSLGLSSTPGVETSVLDALDAKVIYFGVLVSPSADGEVDHLKLTQTILDNIPGINDGVSNNETVFTDYGTMSSNQHQIEFDVVNGDWKNDTGSPNKQIFELNSAYYTWYGNVSDAYKNSLGNNYERIRWGNSVVMQNQVFDGDWLTVCQITAAGNTLIKGDDKHFTIDGDILIDFENHTPQLGDTFDLITAKTITSNNVGGLFDQVLFEGYTPQKYSLEIVTVPEGQALRLTIINNVLSANDFSIDSKVNISPNPANDKLSIDITDLTNVKLQVMDVSGNVLLNQNLYKTTNTITVNQLSKGVYIFKVIANEGSTVSKIIKN